MPHTLRGYLDQLGERLLRVKDEIDPVHQLAVLCSEASGPVLFENLKGYPGWSACDILVKDRVSQALAFGTEPEHVVSFLAERMARGPGKTTVVPRGPVQEVILRGAEADLTKLPIPIHSYGDAGRYLGSGMVITKDPETGICNEAYLRAQLKGPRKFGFSMAQRHNYAHYAKWRTRKEPMPMAFVIGMHPAYEVIANYSGPHPDFDELQLGAGVLGETLEMVRAQTVDLNVPAHAEVVIEGTVPPEEREIEGPFGEFTGYTSGFAKPAPVFHVSAITMRRNPIFRHMQATIFTDHQPLEAVPLEAFYYKRLQETHGGTEIHDIHVAPWASRFVLIVKMTPRSEGHARDVGLSALSGSNYSVKIAIVVDEDVDIYDGRDVLWAISTRVDPARDVIVLPHERLSSLDLSIATFMPELTEKYGHSRIRVGGKMVIDATKPPLWRAQEREVFKRIQPMGAEDASLARLRQLVKQPRSPR
jgi:2,5-furandicarboxylate decarboxylase 1